MSALRFSFLGVVFLALWFATLTSAADSQLVCQAGNKCDFGCRCFLYHVEWRADQNTLWINVTNTCRWSVSFVAFGLANFNGLISPTNGQTYVGRVSTYRVTYTNANGNPGFPSVKFEVIEDNGFSSGGWEVFALVFDGSVQPAFGQLLQFQVHAGTVIETVQGINIQRCTVVPPTTVAVTTSPATTAALTTEAVTTVAVTTLPLTTESVTTVAVTTQAVTTEAVTTQPVTTEAATTIAVTTQPVTTVAVTTEALTTQPVTTVAVTTEAVTTQPVTTLPVTTGTTGTTATTGNDVGSTTSPSVGPLSLCSNVVDATCKHLTLSLDTESVSAASLHVVSFGNFASSGSDVEGRLAVKNHLWLDQGFSIGQKLNDGVQHSLIVGKNCSWSGGSLLPVGAKSWIGGAFDAPAYLQFTQTNAPCYGCLDSAFDALQACYGQRALQLTQALADTVAASVIFGNGLAIACSASTTVQYMTISADTLSAISWYQLDSNCDLQNAFVIRVVPAPLSLTTDLTLVGSSFPAFKEVVYVIAGPGSISTSVGITGHILAPYATLQNPSGVIQGKVVVGQAAQVAQINLLCV